MPRLLMDVTFWDLNSEGDDPNSELLKLRSSSYWRSTKRMLKKPQRTAAEIGFDSHYIIASLERSSLWLSPTKIQKLLKCSSFTLSKYRKIGFFEVRDLKRKTSAQARLRYHRDSVIEFVQICNLLKSKFRNGRVRESGVILAGSRKLLKKVEWNQLPKDLTPKEVALLMGCSTSSVIRLINKRLLFAKKRTPKRWIIPKNEIFRIKDKIFLVPTFGRLI